MLPFVPYPEFHPLEKIASYSTQRIHPLKNITFHSIYGEPDLAGSLHCRNSGDLLPVTHFAMICGELDVVSNLH